MKKAKSVCFPRSHLAFALFSISCFFGGKKSFGCQARNTNSRTIHRYPRHTCERKFSHENAGVESLLNVHCHTLAEGESFDGKRIVGGKLYDRFLCNIVPNALLFSCVRTAREMCIKILLSNYFISMLHLAF